MKLAFGEIPQGPVNGASKEDSDMDQPQRQFAYPALFRTLIPRHKRPAESSFSKELRKPTTQTKSFLTSHSFEGYNWFARRAFLTSCYNFSDRLMHASQRPMALHNHCSHVSLNSCQNYPSHTALFKAWQAEFAVQYIKIPCKYHSQHIK